MLFRSGCGLTSDGDGVKHRSAHPPRGGVDAGCKSCWPGTHHHQIVELLDRNGPLVQTNGAGQLGVAGIAQQSAPSEQNDWPRRYVGVRAEQGFRTRVVKGNPCSRTSFGLTGSPASR